MSNFNVTGIVSEKGNRIYSPNNPPVLSVSSRCVEKTIGGQSGTGQWVDTGFTTAELGAGEVVSGIYAIGMSSGQYGNNALWYLAGMLWSGSNLYIAINRGANDHSDQIKVVITVLKVTAS